MQEITKIEIIIEQIQLPLILTLIKDVIGSGIHGEYDGQELSDLMKNSYFIILVPEEKGNALVQLAEPFLTKRGGVIMTSRVNWIHY